VRVELAAGRELTHNSDHCFSTFLLQRNFPQMHALLMEPYAMIQVSILFFAINLLNSGFAITSAGATIRRTRRLPRALGQKYNCVVQKVTNALQKEMMKVNETHGHAVYEKIKGPHYFRFAAEGLIFFL